MSKANTFRVSDLSSIRNLDHEDLLLVSDWENGKCYSKKMDIGKLMREVAADSIVSAAVLNPATPIGRAVREAVPVQQIVDAVMTQLTPVLSAHVLRTIYDNCGLVWDALDGRVDSRNVVDGGTAES